MFKFSKIPGIPKLMNNDTEDILSQTDASFQYNFKSIKRD